MIRRILTGMRTTGRLHLGHYVGALQNWLELQNEYESYLLLADIQALSTHFDRVEGLEDSVRQVVIDWLSVGLNPQVSSFVLQSRVPEYYELTSYFTFLVSMGALEGNPTLKDEIKNYGLSQVNLGFMSYPVSQASDVLLLSPISPQPGDELLVPVGEDQLAHIELTRDIARWFNRQYSPIFIEPKTKVGRIPRLQDLSTSGKKMGKSTNNAIFLSDTPTEVQEKVRQGMTDPAKIRRGNPGNPDVCPIFSYHKLFQSTEVVEEVNGGCRAGLLGCVECKAKLATALNTMLDPIRDSRSKIEQHPNLVTEAIMVGTKRARTVGKVTMEAVRHAMHLDYPSILGNQTDNLSP